MDIFVLKGILYVLILAYASFCDIKTKTIPDKVHILIIIVALINLNSLNSIIGLLLVPIPFFTTALIKNGGINCC